jgi:hypothetical protein
VIPSCYELALGLGLGSEAVSVKRAVLAGPSSVSALGKRTCASVMWIVGPISPLQMSSYEAGGGLWKQSYARQG